MTALNIGSARSAPFRAAIAAAFEKQNARDGRQPPDLGHAKGERAVHHAVNQQAVFGGIDIRDAAVMPLVMQR
jgi:hypothetical protein